MTSGQTKVNLVAVYPSASQTIVKLRIEDLDLEQSTEKMVFLPLHTLNLSLAGFDGNQIYDQDIEVEHGKQLTTLNLDPLTNFDATVTIEISNLKRRNTMSGQYETVPGPWRFEFTPNVPEEQRFSRQTQVNEERDVDGVKIRLTEIHESSSETRVSYEIVTPPGINRESLGAPTISYGTQTFEGRDYGAMPGGAYSFVSFPPIPHDAGDIRISFPYFRSLTGPSASFTINFPEVEQSVGPQIPLAQTIEVAGRNLRFTELDLSGESEFRLTYVPADNASNDLELAGPGQLSDDLGNIYIARGSITSVTGPLTSEVKKQSIRFGGQLPDEASEISISIGKTGLFSSSDFEFHVSIP